MMKAPLIDCASTDIWQVVAGLWWRHLIIDRFFTFLKGYLPTFFAMVRRSVSSKQRCTRSLPILYGTPAHADSKQTSQYSILDLHDMLSALHSFDAVAWSRGRPTDFAPCVGYLYSRDAPKDPSAALLHLINQILDYIVCTTRWSRSNNSCQQIGATSGPAYLLLLPPTPGCVGRCYCCHRDRQGSEVQRLYLQ